ncbi:MAG: phospho-sugar mutase [Bacteroidetes bacterium]|nr:phospho-sugar mutase [Bacteroidota bacterium]
MTNPVENSAIENAKRWLGEQFDEETRKQVQYLIDHDTKELNDAFYRLLEFGTGGLRGIMGVGTNRMNKYTVGMATQGLCNYLKSVYPDTAISAAVSYDCRHNSKAFARITAEVFAANGFKVFLFDDMRPTPELSFAIRELKCHTGVMITASHNPKEYNGYKAYWNDGAQMINPHDVNVIQEVEKITDISAVRFNAEAGHIEMVGAEIDRKYLDKVLQQSLSPEAIRRHHDMPIVYTPLHGTGMKMVPQALHQFGFTNIIKVEEQFIPDGDFPTTPSPNPEESAALALAIEKAKKTGAELVMATDPDSDRVGIAVKNDAGEFVLLNGNQTAAVLFYYVLKQWKDRGKLIGKEFIVSTIVTGEILHDIAGYFHVPCFDVLTGFKYIADVIRQQEGKMQYIIGGEESFGYLIGDFVRDKDAVTACSLIAEAAAWAKEEGKTPYEVLIDLYLQFGVSYDSLLSITRKGQKGTEEIQSMMTNFRKNPFQTIAGSKVIKIKDYLTPEERDLTSGLSIPIDLPKSNVLQFFLEDGSRISARPSGTEPKIKFYFSIRHPLENKNDLRKVESSLKAKTEAIIQSMGLR